MTQSHKGRWEVKQIVSSIEINRDCPNVDLLQTLIQQRQECLGHSMIAMIYNEYSNKYRRGKNRCKRCGLKLEFVPKTEKP
jgi:hypothetical protein